MPIETIAAGISQAITIVESLRQVAKKVKDAEVNRLLADLSLALSDVKMKLADSQTENANLKSKIFELNEEINSLRKRLTETEAQKNLKPTKPWQNSPQKEQILKVLLSMSQIDGQPFEIEQIAQKLKYHVHTLPYRWAAGVDIAIWDIIGKASG